MQVDNKSRVEENRTIWQLTHELTQANDALQRLGHMVSHDLRGPLANMEALMQMFNRSDMGADEHADILNLLGIAFTDFRKHLDDLNELMKTRSNSGQMWEKLDIHKEYNNTRQQLLGLLSSADGHIYTDIEVECLFSVRLYIQSILYNLVSNSIKYRSPERKLEINFVAYTKGENVVITVQDNGLGIDLKKNRERLFKPYSRLQSEGEGHGLGLYLVKTQVETLGGWLEVSSVPGEGSLFKVVLPQKCPKGL